MSEFTKREIEIIKLLCLENKEIGEILRISPATVQTHITNIRQKVVASSRASLIVELLKAEVVKIDEIVTN